MNSARAADWFERITGFREKDHAGTRALLAVEGDQLVSLVDGRRHGIGRLDIPSLADLRAAPLPAQRPRTTVCCLAADVRALHREPRFAGALFQVASQFNLVEMVGPHVTPEHGVTGYSDDRTQGPACAIAAGAGTIYRNYFAPVAGARGQTAERQIDTLASLGDTLAAHLGCRRADLWTMRNGYALATRDGLAAIGRWLADAGEPQRDRLRGALRLVKHAGLDAQAWG